MTNAVMPDTHPGEPVGWGRDPAGQSYQEHVHALWKRFIDGEALEENTLPAHIINGWELSRHNNVDPMRPQIPPVLSPAELKKLCMEHATLLEAAEPVLNMLEFSIRGTGSIATLAVAPGYLLAVVGDSHQLGAADTVFNVPGANRCIQTVGASALSLCMVERRPVQISGYEHYNRCFHNWRCAGAPIFCGDDTPIASLTISSHVDVKDAHTLLLARSCADCISIRLRELDLTDRYKKLSAFIESVQNSLPEAVIALNTQGVITHANYRARSLFCGPGERTLVGKDIVTFFNKADAQRYRRIMEQGESHTLELELFTNKGSVYFMCRFVPILLTGNEFCGMTFSICHPTQILTIARHVGGNYAKYSFDAIKGDSPLLKQQITLAKRAATTRYRILLSGESGTGKELFAQSIHNHSAARNGPFVAISCAAIPRDLIESELFGYVGGAFTGARSSGMIGKMELANGGTLFLDEVNSLPLEMQAKFLRALQQQEVMRIGDTKPTPLNFCIIAATNQNLREAVQQGLFREDLFFRINVVELNIPPLRDRKGDIALLANIFFKRISRETSIPFTRVSPEAMAILQAYSWPGNVRELDNMCERALLMSRGGIIAPDDLPMDLRGKSAACPAHVQPLPPAKGEEPPAANLRDMYRESILAALDMHQDNISKAAEHLGIARSTLYRNMKKFGLEKRA